MAPNTTYHDSLKCYPTEIFHRRIPYNPLDLQFRNANKPVERKCKDVNEVLNKMNCIFSDNLDNIISAYHKYKMYYDRKARAQPLKVNEFVFLLVGTHKTQCVHRMRLRLFKPVFPIDDINVSKHLYPTMKGLKTQTYSIRIFRQPTKKIKTKTTI